jgi:hypothetical protein
VEIDEVVKTRQCDGPLPIPRQGGAEGNLQALVLV